MTPLCSCKVYRALADRLDGAGAWLALVPLRLVLAWDFFEAGLEKWRGENWFADIQSAFPFPFDLLPVELSWRLATATELVAPVLLVLGLATRFAGVSLAVLTVVAWAAVHAGNGYNVCDNGYKLPLVYLVMLVPLILSGPGKLSLDHWLTRRCVRA